MSTRKTPEPQKPVTALLGPADLGHGTALIAEAHALAARVA